MDIIYTDVWSCLFNRSAYAAISLERYAENWLHLFFPLPLQQEVGKRLSLSLFSPAEMWKEAEGVEDAATEAETDRGIV